MEGVADGARDFVFGFRSNKPLALSPGVLMSRLLTLGGDLLALGRETSAFAFECPQLEPWAMEWVPTL